MIPTYSGSDVLAGWELLRQDLLQVAGDWLWHEREAGAQPLPGLLGLGAGAHREQLAAVLAPLLPGIFTGHNIWRQLEWLAQLAEQAAPAAIRRQAGIYYTPGPVADFVVERALAHCRWQQERPQTYLDPACGSGLFLWGVFARMIAGREADHELAAAWIGCAHGCDTDALALLVADFGFRLFWQRQFPELPPPEAHLRRFDALAADADGGLLLRRHFPDLHLKLLISNPPYVGERHNKEVFDGLRKGPWAADYRGRGDLYYFFFFLALALGQSDASGASNQISALLTPSYFRTATAAAHLRGRLERDTRLLELVDFGDLRLFPAAGGHHSLLSIFAAGPDPGQPVRLQQCQARGSLKPEQMKQMQADQPAALLRPHHSLFQGPNRVLAWQEIDLAAVLEHMAAAPLQLGEAFDVRQGIVSGADSLSPRQQARYGIAAAPGSGIFVLDRDALESLRGPDTEAWFRPWFKNSDVRPWVPIEQPVSWLIYAQRGSGPLPARLEAHLQRFRPLLEARREVRLGRIPWWQLQWPREPDIFTGPKLLLPQRAKAGIAAYSACPWYASADVYFILPRTGPWTLKALCALLNSPLYTCWWQHRGKRKGSLIELYQHPLTQTPLPDASAIPILETLYTQATTHPHPTFPYHLHQTVCTLFGLETKKKKKTWEAVNNEQF
ncbi:MAG: hypothetical protein ACAI44_20810 [Candidatus Sericytochromatia bacterium]